MEDQPITLAESEQAPEDPTDCGLVAWGLRRSAGQPGDIVSDGDRNFVDDGTKYIPLFAPDGPLNPAALAVLRAAYDAENGRT